MTVLISIAVFIGFMLGISCAFGDKLKDQGFNGIQRMIIYMLITLIVI